MKNHKKIKPASSRKSNKGAQFNGYLEEKNFFLDACH